MVQVFTSYSRRDTETVDSIVAKMTQAGISVWIDREAIKAGNTWRVQIVQAIDTCQAFVLMLSPNSAASDNVRKEIDLSQDSGRTIFAVMLEPTKIPAEIRYQLAGLQFIDVQMLGLEKSIQELIETVKEHLAKFAPVEQETRQAELVIQGVDLGAFTADKQQQLLDFIAQLTSADRSQLQIANLTAGSVHVFVDMPAAAAFELKTMALNRDPRLKQLGITSLRLDGNAKFVNTSSGILTLTATISPLMALWLKIPALLSSVLGPTIGKLLTVFVATALIAALAFTASRALTPLFVPAPTATHTQIPTQPPTFTPVPADTETPTATEAATFTATATQTETPTPTATASPTLTPVPTYAILQGEVVNRNACRHGPGDIYLYRFGLVPTNRMEVRGRVEIWNGKELQTWLWGLPEFFPGECWVNADHVRLDGELSSLEVVYPDKVKVPVMREQRWPLPQNVKVVREGDRVTVSWDFFDVPEGEREGPNSPRYVLEAWLCQDGKVTFNPIPVYEFTSVSMIDQAGCAEPSHGRIYLSEKHGYLGPVEINWPPYPQPTP